MVGGRNGLVGGTGRPQPASGARRRAVAGSEAGGGPAGGE